MKNTRRTFLQKSFLGGTAGLLTLGSSHAAPHETRLADLQTTSSDEGYWRLVRDHFPLSRESTYFNNGTMGLHPLIRYKKCRHMSVITVYMQQT